MCRGELIATIGSFIFMLGVLGVFTIFIIGALSTELNGLDLATGILVGISGIGLLISLVGALIDSKE